jgi:hypothetical protein
LELPRRQKMEEFFDLSEFSEFDRRLLNTMYERLSADCETADSRDKRNTTLINFTSCKVLSDVEGILKASKINESLYETFQTYYNYILKGNSETIIPDNPFTVAELHPDFFPISKNVLRERVLALMEYFLAVQQKVTIETFNMMAAAGENKIKTTCEALSEISQSLASMQFRGSEVRDDEIADLVKTIGDKYRLPNLYSEFQIIILYFDVFPFNYEKFKEVYTYKIGDLSIEDIEVQRRYLLSLLRKDAHYIRRRDFINRICEQYDQTLKKIKDETENETKRIRELYGETTDKLIDFTNQLIDEL